MGQLRALNRNDAVVSGYFHCHRNTRSELVNGRLPGRETKGPLAVKTCWATSEAVWGSGALNGDGSDPAFCQDVELGDNRRRLSMAALE